MSRKYILYMKNCIKQWKTPDLMALGHAVKMFCYVMLHQEATPLPTPACAWAWPARPVRKSLKQVHWGKSMVDNHPKQMIPLWIKSKCWCQRFYSDKSRDVDPFLEKTLYRIASTKLLFKMAISIKLLAPSHSLNVLFWPGGGSWPSIISQTPTLIHCHLAWMLQLLLPSWCQAPSNL